jgi:AhpD family alkylhydroperoxidase
MHHDYTLRDKQVRESMDTLGAILPKQMAAFARLHESTTSNGVLSKKVKELIALAIGITVRCDGCIALHISDALQAGANQKEILETIGVAILMGGGPSVVYGGEAMKALEQIESMSGAA